MLYLLSNPVIQPTAPRLNIKTAFPGMGWGRVIFIMGIPTQIARSVWPTWDPPGSWQPQVGPMLDPWILLSGYTLNTVLILRRCPRRFSIKCCMSSIRIPRWESPCLAKWSLYWYIYIYGYIPLFIDRLAQSYGSFNASANLDALSFASKTYVDWLVPEILQCVSNGVTSFCTTSSIFEYLKFKNNKPYPQISKMFILRLELINYIFVVMLAYAYYHNIL